MPASSEEELRGLNLEQLEVLTNDLQEKLQPAGFVVNAKVPDNRANNGGQTMSDAVEKAMEDRETAISSAFRRGEVENEIQWIRTLQQMLGWPSGDEQESLQMTLEHLQAPFAFLAGVHTRPAGT